MDTGDDGDSHSNKSASPAKKKPAVAAKKAVVARAGATKLAAPKKPLAGASTLPKPGAGAKLPVYVGKPAGPKLTRTPSNGSASGAKAPAAGGVKLPTGGIKLPGASTAGGAGGGIKLPGGGPKFRSLGLSRRNNVKPLHQQNA